MATTHRFRDHTAGYHESRQYLIRFDKAGAILGESLDPYFGRKLEICLDPAADKTIFQYLRRLDVLDAGLSDRLSRRIRALLDTHQEFLMHGDCEIGEEEYHLHIHGQGVRVFSGEPVFTLLFLDQTQITRLRRLYELMFRLANHELKSPLACILGAAEFCEGDMAKNNIEGIRTCLEMIVRNAVEMEQMISRYLDLSRIESGSFTLSPGDLLFSADVLNPLVSELKPALIAKEMTVEFQCTGSQREPMIAADQEALSIVLRNLISNAVKYGRPGTTIRVDLAVEDPTVEISVENEGPTLSGRQLQDIFDKFVRLDATYGSRGSGLGLHVAKKLVDMWKGTIRVESAQGRTRFAVTLPSD